MSTAPALIKCTLFFFLVASVCSSRVLKYHLDDLINNCTAQLNNSLPQTCNRTLLGLTNDFPEPSSSEGLAALNAAFAQTCTPACIEPTVQYYQCVFFELSDYASDKYVRDLLCGHDNEEFCLVRYFRLNDTVPELDTCPDTNYNSTLVCDSTTPQSCHNDLSTFSSQMGCCAVGFFSLQNCSVTFDPPCRFNAPTPSTTPTASPANGLYPFTALSMIAFAILGLLF
uniref:FZ domain-containing protein n=1 Tax=Amphimedon queenslandica TaxID=400682 RepID=A0A1X7VML9_AMPQE